METFIIVVVYFLIIGGFAYSTWLSWLNYSNRNAEIPDNVKDIYDEKEYKRWLNYTMENFRFNKIISSIDTLIFVSFLVFGVFVLFDDVSKQLFVDNRLQILAFLGIYFIISTILGIYPSYYHTFVIEEKYGFNKTTKKTFIIDKVKSFFLMIIFGGGAVYGLLVINDYTGKLFFIYAWIAISIVLLVINIFYAYLIIPIFNKLTPIEEGELKEGITAFANSVGYEVSKISVMNESKRSSRLNAMFFGMGKGKRVVLYDTLVEKMNTEEIIAVLAHEIGHGKHKHFVFGITQLVINLFIYVGLFGILIRSDILATTFGFEKAHFGFALILFFLLTVPINILLNFISAQFSRKHEYQADAFAAKNYKKEPMISALKVLAKENFVNLTPHPLYVKLTYSHPPITDRIDAISKL